MSKKRLIHKGTSLRDAIRFARKHGCRIDYPASTGEVCVIAPNGNRTRVNNRRKDTPRKLLCLLRQLIDGRSHA